MMKKIILWLCCIFLPQIIIAADGEEALLKAFNYYQNHVVNIEYKTDTVDTLMGDRGTWNGTGFVIDPERGYVATNAHVASHWMTEIPHITLDNGKVYDPSQIELIYTNPTGQQHDFAILQIKDFSYSLQPLAFSRDTKEIPTGTLVGMRGSRKISQSLISGKLIDKYKVISLQNFPFGCQHLYLLDAPAIDGFSGSPVFTADRKIIGLLTSGNKRFANLTPISYVLDPLESLGQGIDPAYYMLGIDFCKRKLRELEKFYGFNDQDIKINLRTNPDYKNYLLQVKRVNPAVMPTSQVMADDVLKKINGQIIGPDYYALHQIVQEAGKTGKHIHLEFDRNGIPINVNLNPVRHRSSDLAVVSLDQQWISPAQPFILYHYGIAPGIPITFQKPYKPQKIVRVGDIPVKTFVELFNILCRHHRHRYILSPKEVMLHYEDGTTLSWMVKSCKVFSLRKYDQVKKKWLQTTKTKFFKNDRNTIKRKHTSRFQRKQKKK